MTRTEAYIQLLYGDQVGHHQLSTHLAMREDRKIIALGVVSLFDYRKHFTDKDKPELDDDWYVSRAKHDTH